MSSYNALNSASTMTIPTTKLEANLFHNYYDQAKFEMRVGLQSCW